MGIIRKTKSVKILLEIFEHTEEALSGIDLIERLQGKMNKTTVYRILARLEDEGMLHSFKDEKGLKWYAKGGGASQHTSLHPHFQCRNCGKIECLDLNISIPSLPKRKIYSAEFLLIGICEDCLSL